MYKRFGLYITLFWSFSGFAQPYISDGGDFSVDQRRGCRDLLITVTNINPGTDVILYQYEGNGSPVTASSTHNYTSTGNYWLYQFIQGPTGDKVDSIFIEIFDPEIVEFTLESCNNNNVAVTIDNTTYDLYEVDYGDGTIVQVPVFGFPPTHSYNSAGPFNVSVVGLYTTANNQCGLNTASYTPVNFVQPAVLNQIEVLDNATIAIDYTLAPYTSTTLEISLNGNLTYQTFKALDQSTTRDTLRGLNLNNTYCLRISSNDACSNFKAYSNEVCSASLAVTPANDAMNLTWQTQYLANFNTVNILRDNIVIYSGTNPDLSYNDSTAICNTAYCYQLELVNNDGGRSLSEIACATAFSTTQPAPVANVSTSIENNVITWSWELSPGELSGSSRILTESGEVIATTTQNSIFQDVVLPLPCLQWEFTNSCGNTSELSRVFCPLIAEYQVSPEGSTLLNWNAYDGWSGGTAGYALLIFDQNLNQVDSIWVGANTSYEDPLPVDDNQVSYYRVIAVPNEPGINVSQSNLIEVERPPVISLPSSFTPNGDGLNDLFEVTGKYIMTHELTIFNRWGSILFNSENEGWDGTQSGKKVSSGTYIYKVKVKDFTGKEHIRTGTVLILKD